MEKLLAIRMNKFFLLSIFLVNFFLLEGQEIRKDFSFQGYVKYLPSYLGYSDNESEVNHLIHNRINMRGYIGDNFSVGLDLRNRILFGETQVIFEDKGIIDLSNFIVDTRDFKIHSVIDRIWLKYQIDKIEISIGRQRVNWGINTIWNPNDLFNAYNFIDFDYIERPGSDVLRFQYTGDDLSSLDIVYKPSKYNGSVISALYRINKGGYDFQFLAANYYDDLALGGGWAGNIKNAGFKGEITYFISKKKTQDNSTSFSTSIDYSFRNGLYILATHLYNSNGISDPDKFNLENLTDNILSPKNLMPSKNSFLIQASKQISPAINSSLAIMHGQGVKFLFISPNISYEIDSSYDASIIGQFFYMDQDKIYKNLLKGIYFQFKYSF